MHLKSVKIGKKDTCLTYALKRTGLDYLDLSCLGSAKFFFDFIEFNIDQLKIGDIVYFCKNQKEVLIPSEISESSEKGINLIEHPRSINNHCAVYEGNGMFSDCTKKDERFMFHNCLRLQTINDFKYKPSFILKIKKEFKNEKSSVIH